MEHMIAGDQAQQQKITEIKESVRIPMPKLIPAVSKMVHQIINGVPNAYVNVSAALRREGGRYSRGIRRNLKWISILGHFISTGTQDIFCSCLYKLGRIDIIVTFILGSRYSFKRCYGSRPTYAVGAGT